MTYPIVDMRELHLPGRTGRWKLGPRARVDIPRPREGHFALVYKVDNRFVLDHGKLRPRDDDVINASQVSVVDLSRQKQVEVELPVPSQDHSIFTVVVTFACTVDDPVAVVQGGIIDPGPILLTYLKSHHGYSQMGLGFPIAEVNEARRYINAQLDAYATVSGPVIEGMRVTMASVEVRIPPEERAKAARRQEIAVRRLALEAELERSGMTEGDRLEALRATADLLSDPQGALQVAYLAGELTAAQPAESTAHQDRAEDAG